MPESQEEMFAAHSAWVAGLRAQYEAATTGGRPAGGGVQPSGFGGSGDFGAARGERQLSMAGEAELDLKGKVGGHKPTAVRAVTLMHLGHLLSRNERFAGEEQAFFDVWLDVVMPHALKRV